MGGIITGNSARNVGYSVILTVAEEAHHIHSSFRRQGGPHRRSPRCMNIHTCRKEIRLIPFQDKHLYISDPKALYHIVKVGDIGYNRGIQGLNPDAG
jgi:hypothetical protein